MNLPGEVRRASFRIGDPSAIGWYQSANFPASLLPVGVEQKNRDAHCAEKRGAAKVGKITNSAVELAFISRLTLMIWRKPPSFMKMSLASAKLAQGMIAGMCHGT
jgi:hypothetical protein